jgi:hypothetical protein
MQHFVNSVLGKETCMETGEDGREVLKIMYAAYQSAGEDENRMALSPPRSKAGRSVKKTPQLISGEKKS